MTNIKRVTTVVAETKQDVPPLDIGDQEVAMEPMRCPQCGRFLCYQAIIIGAVRSKCKPCKLWVTLDIIPPPDIIEEESEVEEVSRLNSEAQQDLDRL